MAILKWKDGKGNWISLYANWLRQCLRKDKNLSDLDDKSAARENLELTGDVETHNHDSRYLPMFQEQLNKTKELIDQTSKYVQKAGDAMTGILNFASNTWNGVGDTSYIGDDTTPGHLAIKGKNGDTGIVLDNKDDQGDQAKITYKDKQLTIDKKISATEGFQPFKLDDASLKSNRKIGFFYGATGAPHVDFPYDNIDYGGLSFGKENCDMGQLIFHGHHIYFRANDQDTTTDNGWSEWKELADMNTVVNNANTVKNSLNKQTVSGSTVNVELSSSSTVSGGKHITTHYMANRGIGGGTYSLSTLLNELVKRSHYHTSYNTSADCDCNCNCNCDCRDNDEE